MIDEDDGGGLKALWVRRDTNVTRKYGVRRRLSPDVVDPRYALPSQTVKGENICPLQRL